MGQKHRLSVALLPLSLLRQCLSLRSFKQVLDACDAVGMKVLMDVESFVQAVGAADSNATEDAVFQTGDYLAPHFTAFTCGFTFF